MCFTLGSHKVLKRSEKPPYCRFAPPNTQFRLVELFTKQFQRNCLIIPNGLHCVIPGVGKARGEVLLLLPCATENTRSRPVQLFTKQFHTGYSRKLGLRCKGFSET
jgi:hypothetical protein